MQANPSKPKPSQTKQPLEVVKEGSIVIPIYANQNLIPERDPQTGAIIYDTLPTGDRKARIKYQSTIYIVAYYSGTQRIRQKFSNLDKARKEAELAAIKLARGETEALKLTGGDRADYIRAMQTLREWKPDANLHLFIADCVRAARRLPENVTFTEVVEDYRKRHPVGLPPKTVREVLNELIAAKTAAKRSDVYIKDLNSRLGAFADNFGVRIANVTGRDVETYIRNLKIPNADENLRRHVSGRTQNNIRRLIGTLFQFAIKRGYLPKDHDEISAVEKAAVDSGEIEIFSPAELEKLFAACIKPVQERGKWRTREDMIPYLAIAAFCGLRAAEIQRLDWSEIHLTGSEKFVEVKAGKAKTASRRTVPISANCAAWLERYAKTSGPVVTLARTDKQLFIYLAGKAGVPWKHNGLRHSFISYRLAVVKDVGQVSLEAGNSPGMVFKHYRQLVRESEAKEWFDLMPPKQDQPAPTVTATASYEAQPAVVPVDTAASVAIRAH